MSIADKLLTVSENVSKVFEAGKKSEYDRFWDAQQFKGARTSYEYAFAGWGNGIFKPKYDIILGLGYTGTSMFNQNSEVNIAEALEKQGVILDTTKCGNMQSLFQRTDSVRLPELNCTHAMDYNNNGLQYTFNGSKAETIDKLIVVENLKYYYSFNGCTNLKNIVFEGVIGEDISFPVSPLSKESIESIVNHLSESSCGKTLTLMKTAVNNAFGIDVDDETTYPEGSEYYTLRHSKDNWTFSYV